MQLITVLADALAPVLLTAGLVGVAYGGVQLLRRKHASEHASGEK